MGNLSFWVDLAAESAFSQKVLLMALCSGKTPRPPFCHNADLNGRGRMTMPERRPDMVRIWDLPTRVFHWALATAVVALLVTAKIGGDAMVWHGRLGYAVGALLLFRLAWGWMGGHWSRFRAFPPSPVAAFRYLRDKASRVRPGHSPLGALSVYALLFFLFAQVATGLFSDDEVEFSGPLGVLVSNRMVKLCTRYHKSIGQYVLIALVLLHLGAIAYYHLRARRNLIGPMLHGDARVADEAPASRDDWRARRAARGGVLVSAGAVPWFV
jgi:cytochrome b